MPDAYRIASLNPEQRRAAVHGMAEPGDAHGPLLIIAGAGSGKTETLAHRVTQLIRHGADPGRILLLTFSRRAAQEMERRVGRILNKDAGLGAPARASIGSFTLSARAFCVNSPLSLDLIPLSPFTTVKTPPIC